MKIIFMKRVTREIIQDASKDVDRKSSWNVLGICVLLTSIFGLWPIWENNFFLKICWFIGTFELTITTIGCFYEIIFSCDYAEVNVDVLLAISFALLSLAKLILYHVHRDILKYSIESAVEDWKSVKTGQIHSIIEGSKKIRERVTQVYLIIAIIAASMHPMQTYFSDPDTFIEVTEYDKALRSNKTMMIMKKKFLFPSVCYLNDISQTFYNAITINQFLQYVISVGVNIGADTFFISITCHLCGQLKILKVQFASFKVLKNETQMKDNFRELVSRHKQLLKMANLLETSFNMIVFIQLLMNFLLINIAGFNFLINLKRRNYYGATKNCGIASFILVQTFMYSYIGENVSNEVEGITQSIYDGPWTNMPKSISKSIIFLMIRSNMPFHLTAGKFFKMTRSTFTDVVKTSISYLSVLNALLED